MGIEPQVIDWGLELTELVQAAVPRGRISIGGSQKC